MKITNSSKPKAYETKILPQKKPNFFREIIHINEELLQEFLAHIKDSIYTTEKKVKPSPQ